MEDQENITAKGGRKLRAEHIPVSCRKEPASRVYDGKEIISERHRHRWEFNNRYLEDLKSRYDRQRKTLKADQK